MKNIPKFTKYLIDILLVVSALCVLAIPFLPKGFFLYFTANEGDTLTLRLVLLSSGLLSTAILFTLRQLYSSMMAGDPFNRKNPALLGRIGILGLIIAAIYGLKLIFIPTFGTMMIVIVFIVCFLFCFTLRDLFDRAANYKEENELTI